MEQHAHCAGEQGGVAMTAAACVAA
jgi:hypothetical protein